MYWTSVFILLEGNTLHTLEYVISNRVYRQKTKLRFHSTNDIIGTHSIRDRFVGIYGEEKAENKNL